MIKVVASVHTLPAGNIAIAGFPGMGLVGKTAAEFIAKALRARHVASIYCTGFPAHLLIRGRGSSSLIKIDIYHAAVDSKGIFIVTSDAQPMEDRFQNELSYAIVTFLKERGVERVVAGAAYVTEAVVPSRRVFVAGSTDLVKEFAERADAVPLEEGVISGMNGVIVGWAQVEGMSSVCVLGETWRSIVEMEQVDYGAARVVIDAVSKVFGLNVDTSELANYASRIEKEVLERLGRFAKSGQEGRRSYYIT
ncbi:MAG: proteasome assembly chaperone family protein [Crenarchaeota archaeon]|nr:proteasome assembly chaperone family protein [Thermoproteota archaeon]